jgi:hypothetical protein
MEDERQTVRPIERQYPSHENQMIAAFIYELGRALESGAAAGQEVSVM